MMKKLRINNVLHESQEGVIVPLAAVCMTMVIFSIIMLGVDIANVKTKSRLVQKKLDEICTLVSTRSVIEREASIRFSDQIKTAVQQSLFGPGVVITDAVLTIPTMPHDGEEFDFGPSDYFSGDTNYEQRRSAYSERLAMEYQSRKPFLNDGQTEGPMNLRDLIGGPGCGLKAGADCRYRPWMHLSGIGDSDPFPPFLFDNTRHAGAAVGCEISAEISTISSRFLGDEPDKLVARSARWNLVRGINSIHRTDSFDAALEPPTGDVYDVSTSPGLIIAVAPELDTTKAVNPASFTFDLGNYSSAFKNHYDPSSQNDSGPYRSFRRPTKPTKMNADKVLEILNSGGVEKNGGLTSIVDDTVPQGVAPTGINAVVTGGTETSGNGLDNDDTSEPLISPAIGTELRNACMNPAVLLRNLFVSTIVELSSRHGSLRNMTMFLTVNPEQKGSLTAVPPTAITDFGDDIAKRRYQLPFTVTNLGPSYAGWINPFQNNGGSSDPQARKLHALFTGQLRDCYHLYGGEISRYFGGGDSSNVLSSALNNQGFEDPATYSWASSLSKVGGTYTPLNDPDLGDGWDQGDPWTNKGNPFSFTGNPNARLLTLGEVSASLGSVQRCPTSDPVGLGSFNGVCTDSVPTRADLVGLMQFVNQTNVRAIKSPGLFPRTGGETSEQTGYDERATIPLRNRFTPLLLVLHSPPDTGQVSLLQSLSSQFSRVDGENDARPIMVAYFPTNEADSSLVSLDLIRKAFNIPVPPAPGSTASGISVEPPKPFNYLFVFSALEKSTSRDLAKYTGNPDAAFAQFWKNSIEGLAIPNANANGFSPESDWPVSRAQKVFYEYILKSGQAL